MVNEIWKNIIYVKENGTVIDFSGHYLVSNLGRVKSLPRTKHNSTQQVKERILKEYKNEFGYSFVNLKLNGVQYNLPIHRIIACAFIPNIENKPHVDHIIPLKNGGTNTIENLRWVTRNENQNNSLSTINMRKAKIGKYNGKDNPMFGKKHTMESKAKQRKKALELRGTSIVAVNVIDGEIIKFDCEKDACKHFKTSAKFTKVWCNTDKIRKNYKFYTIDYYENEILGSVINNG